jgi:hypothetical protein
MKSINFLLSVKNHKILQFNVIISNIQALECNKIQFYFQIYTFMEVLYLVLLKCRINLFISLFIGND